MGFHVCEYLTFVEGKALGLKHLDVFYSSGDNIVTYSSGRTWRMPDMATLYVELGWLPPAAFIEDVMKHDVVAGARIQTRSMADGPVLIGYLNPRDNPLPRPFGINPALPEGFLDRMQSHLQAAAPNRLQSKGPVFRGPGP